MTSTGISLLRKMLMMLWLMMSVNLCRAQDPEDPSPTDPAVPVDGGITLLMVAGTAIGLKKIGSQKRRNTF